MRKQPVVLRVDRHPDVTTVVLAGELDLAVVDELRETLERECERRPGRLVVDLAAVDFIDSSALHLFVSLHRRLRGDADSSFEIVGVNNSIRRVFSIAKLDAVRHLEAQGQAAQ
jgi:anti-anti-sigma factor